MESIRQMIISDETQIILSFAQIGFLAVVIWRVAVIYADLKGKITDNVTKIEKQDIKIENLESENNLIKVTQAVLETKLENIESGVVEIKAMLARHVQQ